MLNRALLMYALQFRRVPHIDVSHEADDVQLMYQVIQQMLEGSREQKPVILHCANAGTVVRMIAVVAAVMGGDVQIRGDDQMMKRPVMEMVVMLRQLGVEVACTEHEGYLPLHIRSKGVLARESVTRVSASQSSQHLSGLLLAAPFIPGGLRIELPHETVSWPYVNMTLQMMKDAGAVLSHDENMLSIAPAGYPNISINPEADWSSAAFFYQALSLMPTGSELMLRNLYRTQMQGDEVAAELFAQLGVETSQAEGGIRILKTGMPLSMVNADFTHCPDLFNTFAMAVAGAGTEAVLTGLSHLPFKESDRLDNLCRGFRENGFGFELDGFSLRINKGSPNASRTLWFNSFEDHRLAMSAATMGVRFPVIVNNPSVVSKSFPGFFAQLGKLAHIESPDRF